MRLAVSILVFLVATLSVLAQSPPPRTPGRVGGSPNNPSALRPRTGGEGGVAALDASTALTPEEQKQYSVAQQSVPDLTVYDFFQIEYLSKNLQSRNPATNLEQLMQRIAAKDKHVVAALEEFGLNKKEAKKMYEEAKAAADARKGQLLQ